MTHKPVLLKVWNQDLLTPLDISFIRLDVCPEIDDKDLARMPHDHIGRMHQRSPEIISYCFALQYNKDDIIVLPVLCIYVY